MYPKRRKLVFQEETANFLVNNSISKKETFLQAPTGSGKTFIMSLFVEKYLQNPLFSSISTSFVFIAPSTGSLDYQGYEKISNYLKNDWISGFKTSYIGLSDKKSKGKYLQNIDMFEKNTIYFIGWSLFGKNSNLTNVDSERNNLFRVLANTKKSNTRIVLIFDEAHREVVNINSETKQIALDSFNYFRAIHISATLDDPDYVVSLKDVREEAVIKKSVLINCGKSSDYDLDTDDEIEQLLYSAIKKQNEVKKAYFRRNIKNKPLIIVQIPDRQRTKNIDTDDYYIPKVKKILEKQGFFEGNNYAIWLSDKKTTKNKEELVDMQSKYEILIFKQAVATGWDLPRANILVRLREPKSPKFDIQTLGRILRNPFFRYYENQLIDNAFVFTFDEKYSSKIQKEKFVTSNSAIKSFPKSIKGKKSSLKMNHIYYDSEIDKNSLISFVVQRSIKQVEEIYIQNGEKIINEYDLTTRLKKKISTQTFEDLDKLRDELNVENQLGFKFSSNFVKDTLFQIFLKYQSVFKNKNHLLEITNSIADKLSPKISKKNFYKFIIKGYSQSLFNSLDYIEFLEKILNKYLQKNSKKHTQEFKLPSSFKYSTNFAKNGWDKINTYQLDGCSKNLDSKLEEKFYEYLKNTCHLLDDVHIFRNLIDQNSFFIEYFNSEFKKAKFFPDFLLIDDRKKNVHVLEVKGRNKMNIDKESSFKFKTAWKFEDAIKINYDVTFWKVNYHKEEWEFCNKDNSCSSARDFLGNINYEFTE